MNIEEQLVRLVTGNLEENLKKELLEKIREDAGLQEEYEKIKQAWSLASYQKKIDRLTIEQSFHRFMDKARPSRKLRIGNILKYAAIALAIFSIGIISEHYLFQNMSSILPQTTAINKITVPNGGKTTLTLADGTEVWLNSGTTFSFPQTFDKKSRDVRIAGEAFFKVAKKDIPFVVSTMYGDIQVLGTSFNLRAYDNMNFQTTLVTGKILFKAGNISQILTPGQQLTIDKNNQIIVKNVGTPPSYSWTEGVLTFDNEPLEDVIRKLERHFNMKIALDSQLASIRFTGKVYNESIEDILDYIDKTKPITYQYDKNKNLIEIKIRK